MGALEGKVAIVTGGGRGIGRAEAHRLAAEGARVVVNDFGGSLVGEGGDRLPAEVVVEEIRAAGGDAIADTGDITEWDTGRRLVAAALDHFGRLDVLVNNAGIARPRMSFNMSEDDWDLVTKIHLTGAVHRHPLRRGALAGRGQARRPRWTRRWCSRRRSTGSRACPDT